MLGGIILAAGLAAVGIAKLIHHRRCAAWSYARCGGFRHHRHHWHQHGAGFGWHDAPRGCGPRGFGPEDDVSAPEGWDAGPVPRGVRWGRGGRLLTYLLDRLDATPAQERVIGAAWDELRTELDGLRGEGKKTRADLAAALRKPAFDEVLLGELYARHDTAIEGARKAFVGFLAKLHEALEEPQRKRLADLLEGGWFRRNLWS